MCFLQGAADVNACLEAPHSLIVSAQASSSSNAVPSTPSSMCHIQAHEHPRIHTELGRPYDNLLALTRVRNVE